MQGTVFSRVTILLMGIVPGIEFEEMFLNVFFFFKSCIIPFSEL